MYIYSYSLVKLRILHMLIIKTVCEVSQKQAFLDLGSKFLYVPMDKDKVSFKTILKGSNKCLNNNLKFISNVFELILI